MNGPSKEEPRGYGPVIRADDGTQHQVNEDEVWTALACTAGAFIAMAALDFSAHEEWTLGETHYFFASDLRLVVRCVGLGIAAWIWWTAAREAREAEQVVRRELAGREFVPGKRPGEEP